MHFFLQADLHFQDCQFKLHPLHSFLSSTSRQENQLEGFCNEIRYKSFISFLCDTITVCVSLLLNIDSYCSCNFKLYILIYLVLIVD